jgi:hypothetical protein
MFIKLFIKRRTQASAWVQKYRRQLIKTDHSTIGFSQ